MSVNANKIYVSYSSITDFDNCSRLYYFKSIYRNPQTGNRVQLVNPYLSLGSAVHDSIDEIVNLKPSERMKISLIRKYNQIWKQYSGKKGGFESKKKELEFKKRGSLMIKKFEKSSLVKTKTIKKEKNLPRMTLTENIDLVGSFDWVEVLKNGNLHIIDFKTGKKEEKNGSWQLPIYHLLALENYGKKIEKLSYWYLEKNNTPTIKEVENPDLFLLKLKEKALKIKEKIKSNDFSCNSQYKKCYWCRNYESILSGKAEFVGFDEKMKKDLYYSDDIKNKFQIFKTKNIDERSEELKKIKEGIINFRKSPLYKERIKNNVFPVIGEGNHHAQIIFIGEAPGKNEVLKGRPFCGNAGRILDELLISADIDRKNVYITNIVKDRPPDNRDPLPREIEIYSPFLDRQINIIKPKIIVGLGRFSSMYLLKKFGLEKEIKPISLIHGKIFKATSDYGLIKIIPMFHPASAIYDYKKKEVMKKDFKRIKKHLH